MVLKFGGSEGGSYFKNDTWEWDGINWTEKSPVHKPSVRDAHALAYYPQLGGIVLFGGNSNYHFMNDTWLWDGTDWEELEPPVSPCIRHRHAMTYHPVRNSLVLFGGWDHFQNPGLDDTWELRLGTCFKFRWRFTSDTGWSDADGGDTDGGAWIDNVWVISDRDTFIEDFESGFAEPAYWSFPEPDGVIDQWHIQHDPDPPFEGGDGGERTTCRLDSSFVYRARPIAGFPAYAAWRSFWYYRLVSPRIPVSGTGCVVQYDAYTRLSVPYCKATDTYSRFYSGARGIWCPWINVDGKAVAGDYDSWDMDVNEDLTALYNNDADSMQFAWDFVDLSRPGDFCEGKTERADYLIDNVSVGFFDGSATQFSVRAIDLLHDTFFTDICGYNSHFAAYDPDTVSFYSGGTQIPGEKQLNVDILDKDDLVSVDLYGSVDRGGTWVENPMTMALPLQPGYPELGGTFQATLCPSDFGEIEWETGTEVLYYVKAGDGLSNEAYFPRTANPLDPDHTGGPQDYFTFSILPMSPETYVGPEILLVDGYERAMNDLSPCFASAGYTRPLEDIYHQVFVDAGYVYDRYDIAGSGGNVHIQPIEFFDYDAVVWFTGPHNDRYLFDAEAQAGIRDYTAAGGKVLVCGDRVAYCLAPEAEGGVGEDSLAGEFMAGVLGCDYLEEMDGAFIRPYVYLEGVDTVNVFGMRTEVFLDTLIVYRECPDLREMSWITTETSPPAGYTAQPLLSVINPAIPGAHMGTYVEHLSFGQCVFLDFDLGGLLNHEYTYCDGLAPPGYQNFQDGRYEGRVDLLLAILERLFQFPSAGPGNGGTAGVPETPRFEWSLHQNGANPFEGSTEIRYQVAAPAMVNISIYDAAGRLVNELVNERKDPGKYTVPWNGTNSTGRRVSSGVYFLRMDAGRFSATSKMLVLR